MPMMIFGKKSVVGMMDYLVKVSLQLQLHPSGMLRSQ